MITAPLMTQGVKVDLPQADAEPLSKEVDEPLVVTVNRQGEMYIDIGQGKDEPIGSDTLVKRVEVVLQHKPKTPIMVRGDAGVAYGRVVETMVLLQSAGASSVGLITEPPES
jgi:biopolymer transport protein TolR